MMVICNDCGMLQLPRHTNLAVSLTAPVTMCKTSAESPLKAMINPLSAIRSHFASVGPRNLAGQRNLLPFEGTAGESETLHIKILRFFWFDPRNELLDATCRIEAKASAIQCFIRGNGVVPLRWCPSSSTPCTP